MKARKSPVILNLNDLERGYNDDQYLGIAAVRARIARRPGRWRAKMRSSGHGPEARHTSLEWPEAA